MAQLWLVLKSSDVVKISIVCSVSGELVFILPIFSVLPNSFSDLSSATQGMSCCLPSPPSVWTSGMTCSCKSQFFQPLTQTYSMSLTSISTPITTNSSQEKNVLLIGHFHSKECYFGSYQRSVSFV